MALLPRLVPLAGRANDMDATQEFLKLLHDPFHGGATASSTAVPPILRIWC